MFDGREFAKRKEVEIRSAIAGMLDKPKMVSIIVGVNKASELYVRMKRKKGEKLGVEFEVVRVKGNVKLDELKKIVRELGESEIDGLMIQLPLPDNLAEYTAEVLSEIPQAKDVDGLRWRESGMLPATARAVISIMNEIELVHGNLSNNKYVVVGYTGNVGAPIYDYLVKIGEDVVGINTKTQNPQEIMENADVLISAVGVPGVVSVGNYKANLVIVDVGIEMVDGKAVGDVAAQVYEQARVAVPVPGGVGPVTIVSLIENLAQIASPGKN